MELEEKEKAERKKRGKSAGGTPKVRLSLHDSWYVVSITLSWPSITLHSLLPVKTRTGLTSVFLDFHLSSARTWWGTLIVFILNEDFWKRFPKWRLLLGKRSVSVCVQFRLWIVSRTNKSWFPALQRTSNIRTPIVFVANENSSTEEIILLE